jgi:hypothetical protein
LRDLIGLAACQGYGGEESEEGWFHWGSGIRQYVDLA